MHINMYIIAKHVKIGSNVSAKYGIAHRLTINSRLVPANSQRSNAGDHLPLWDS